MWKLKGRKHYNNSVFDTEQVYASHKASDFIWKVPNLNPGQHTDYSGCGFYVGFLSSSSKWQDSTSH